MQTIFNTDGGGYWSNVAKPVLITDMQLGYVDHEQDFGELRVYFDTSTWDVKHDGLIYTDALFLTQLRRFLDQHELRGADVDYSEQGMQGDNYVSLDVGAEFLQSWADKFGVDSLAV